MQKRLASQTRTCGKRAAATFVLSCLSFLPVPAGVHGLSAHPTNVAFTAARGSALLRTVRVGATPYALVVDPQRGRVLVFNQGPVQYGFMPTGHGSVSVLDAASGRLLRTMPLGTLSYLWQGRVPAVAALDERSGHVFFLNSGQSLTSYAPLGPANVLMLDSTTGAVRHITTFGSSLVPVALVDDDYTHRIFITRQDRGDDLLMLDAATGKTVRDVAMSQPGTLALDTHLNRVYVGNDGNVSINDAQTGMTLFTAMVPSPIPDTGTGTTPPAMASTAVCALAVDERAGHILASLPIERYDGSASLLDASSGAVLNTVALGNDPCTVAVDARTGRAFVVSYPYMNGGGALILDVLDTHSGDLLRSIPIATAQWDVTFTTALAVDEPHNRIFVASQSSLCGDCLPLPPGMEFSGRLSVLDARTGAVLHSVPLTNGFQHAVAVDERTGRLFVTNDGNGTVSVFDLARL